jgi:hypothetical protein
LGNFERPALRSPPDFGVHRRFAHTASDPLKVQLGDLRGSRQTEGVRRSQWGQKCAVCRFRTHTFASSSHVFRGDSRPSEGESELARNGKQVRGSDGGRKRRQRFITNCSDLRAGLLAFRRADHAPRGQLRLRLATRTRRRHGGSFRGATTGAREDVSQAGSAS